MCFNAKDRPSFEGLVCHILIPFGKNGKLDTDFDTFEVLADGSRVVTEWTEGPKQKLEQALHALGCTNLVWHRVFLDNYAEVIASIDRREPSKTVVLNFCDGSESDGWPGAGVVRELEATELPFTGGNSYFYSLDTEKTDMKRALSKANSDLTPKFVDLTDLSSESFAHALEELAKLTPPLIVKPSPSSSSRGISDKSVVWTIEDAVEQAKELRSLYGGVFVEEFISGREFTALVSGSAETGIRTYNVIERVFNKKLQPHQQLLTFKNKWEEWGTDASSDKAWWNEPAPQEEQAMLQQAARQAYAAVGGNGYARLDLRYDPVRGKVFAIDINSNCSVDDEEGSAMGLILRSSGLGLHDFIADMIEFAFLRNANAARARASST